MDHLGYRMEFVTIGPSTNTSVQPDFDDMRTVGETNHYSRIDIRNDLVYADKVLLRLVQNIRENTLQAVDILKSCEMQYLVMGMAAGSFWDGREGATNYLQMMRVHTSVSMSYLSLRSSRRNSRLQTGRCAISTKIAALTSCASCACSARARCRSRIPPTQCAAKPFASSTATI